ncbi:MAG: flavodoxin-dependent (E)-4-hydroxy-3-methylbut-2-enyl-diphosphate synthase [Caldisericia bacterium]
MCSTSSDTKIKVDIGGVVIGGDSPVAVQSMTKTDTHDVKATLSQIHRLVDVGCEIVRCAVPDMEAIPALREIVKESPIPVVADVHFDARIALASIEAGCAKLRINPGNIKDHAKIKEIAEEARSENVTVRVGANSGSLGGGTESMAERLVDSALKQAQILMDCGLSQIVLSVKSSDIKDTISANRILAEKTKFPIHLGLTESGSLISGLVRSTTALVPLLSDGIGDTLRVSLTADPVLEVKAAWSILEVAGRRKEFPTIISCPTCGRTHGDLLAVLEKVEKALVGITGITVAVMGCEVNGP